MRIKFTTSIAGTNFSHAPGDEVEWPSDDEARRFIESGQATPAGGVTAAASTSAGSDTADRPPAKSRRGGGGKR